MVSVGRCVPRDLQRAVIKNGAPVIDKYPYTALVRLLYSSFFPPVSTPPGLDGERVRAARTRLAH
jgi:hypothetical protein